MRQISDIPPGFPALSVVFGDFQGFPMFSHILPASFYLFGLGVDTTPGLILSLAPDPDRGPNGIFEVAGLGDDAGRCFRCFTAILVFDGVCFFPTPPKDGFS